MYRWETKSLRKPTPPFQLRLSHLHPGIYARPLTTIVNILNGRAYLQHRSLRPYLHISTDMAHDSLDSRPSVFNWGQQGGTAESCIVCKNLLDGAQRIVDKSIQERDNPEVRSDQHQPKAEFVTKIGRLVDLLEDSSCQGHKDLVRNTFSISDECDEVEMHWYPNRDLAILALSTSGGYRGRDVILLDCEQSNLKAPCVGRPRDDDFISFSLMKNWISTCEQHHTEKCCAQIRPPASLSWMIDTWSCCLVPAGKATRYVALSYVWGQTKMFKATTEALGALQANGALEADTDFSLPQVIRHAIALVPRLGERYLWVDSLCIMHDDTECLKRHIFHMASIYAAALFTIVSADGEDADHGIPGLRGISRARKLPPSLKLTSRLCLRPRDPVGISYTPWAFRGRTLQEHVFSRRILVFRGESAQWICREQRCFEDIYQASPLIPHTSRDFKVSEEFDSFFDLALEYPRISQLERILHYYSARRLTYENDILRAISAVFTAHRKAFPSGFFWGLPLDFFDMALLWSHSLYSRRRQARLSSSPYLFPSWTWAGWVGQLRDGQWSSRTYLKDVNEIIFWDSTDRLTIPMLEWHYRPYSDSSEVPIPGQNSAYKSSGPHSGHPLIRATPHPRMH